MAFWTLHAGNSSSDVVTVDDLFRNHASVIQENGESDDMPTVDQLLQTDGLLHEVRLQNPLLMCFVTRKSVMQELLDRSFSQEFLANGTDGDACQKSKLESSICFEIISCDSFMICDALLCDHFEFIMDVMRRPQLEPLVTGRISQLLTNLLNSNEELMKQLLEQHKFGDVVIRHIGNFGFMDCIAKSKIVALLDERLCEALTVEMVNKWSENPELADSSAELFVGLIRRFPTMSLFSRLFEEIFTDGDDSSKLPVKEATIWALIAVCDRFLPSPYVGVELHIVDTQVMIDDNVQASTAAATFDLIDLLNRNKDRLSREFTDSSSDEPFGNLRYLLLCLFMRVIPLSTVGREELRQWIKTTVLDSVILDVFRKWPMNNRAHHAVLGVANMMVSTNLLQDDERDELTRKCIKCWYEMEQNLTLCPGGWGYWCQLIRKMHPAPFELPEMAPCTLAKNAFLWIERRDTENRVRYQQLAPATTVSNNLFEQLWAGGDDDEDETAAWLSSEGPVTDSNSVQKSEQTADEFQSLWWCSPEDMTIFPDLATNDDSSSEDSNERSES